MTHPTQSPAPTPFSAAEQAVIDHASAVLRDCIDTAAEMGKIAYRQALAQEARMAAEPGRHQKYIDFTLAFERAARCVRRCIMLRLKLHEPRPTGYDIALAAQKHAAQRSADQPEHVEQVERVEGAERAERLDRLDDDEFNDMDRPMGTIIAEICADLRIAPPEGIAGWAHLTPNQLAAGPPREREAVQKAVLSITSSSPPRTVDPPRYPLRP